MIKLQSTKYYSLITGAILFLLGFLGFAFRDINMPDAYLLLSLVLGFWGIAVGIGKKSK